MFLGADGDLYLAHHSIADGADPNYVDRFGQSSLHISAWLGYFAMVKLLLDLGANPSLKDRHGDLPRDLATEHLEKKTQGQDGSVVDLLLKAEKAKASAANIAEKPNEPVAGGEAIPEEDKKSEDESESESDGSTSNEEEDQGQRTAPYNREQANFTIGLRVLRKNRGGRRWTPATINSVRVVDGSFIAYDLAYQNGETETGVDARLLRPTGHRVSKNRKAVGSSWFIPGDRVEARFRGLAEWHPGTIRRVVDGGKFLIDYDDGDTEDSVDEALIRPLLKQVEGQAALTSSNTLGRRPGDDLGFRIGAQVEAKQRGATLSYKPGKLTKAHGDGTFDIVFNDGTNEIHVDAANIRLPTLITKPKKRGGFLSRLCF